MIDVDIDDPVVIEAILSILPETPWSRRGKKGMALAFKWSGQSNFKLKASDGQMLVEFLGSGNQLVLPPPSIHPDTGLPYQATENLWEVLDQVPDLPDGIQQILKDELSRLGFATAVSPRSDSVIALARGGALLRPPELPATFNS